MVTLPVDGILYIGSVLRMRRLETVFVATDRKARTVKYVGVRLVESDVFYVSERCLT